MKREENSIEDLEEAFSKLLGSFVFLKFWCTKLKDKGEKKVNIDFILKITDTILNELQEDSSEEDSNVSLSAG